MILSNFARPFQRTTGVTLNSKCLSGVTNTILFFSFFAIRIYQYPDRGTDEDRQRVSRSGSRASSILYRGYPYFLVTLFQHRLSTKKHREPFLFVTRTGEDQDLENVWIISSKSRLLTHILMVTRSDDENSICPLVKGQTIPSAEKMTDAPSKLKHATADVKSCRYLTQERHNLLSNQGSPRTHIWSPTYPTDTEHAVIFKLCWHCNALALPPHVNRSFPDSTATSSNM